MIQTLTEVWPSGLAVVAIVAVLFLANWQMNRSTTAPAHQFRNQMVMLGLSALAAVGIILVLPVTEATRGQLLSFLGILFSAAIALSSTTILGNALAGFMMRAAKSFRVGDFVRVEDRFGRVSERGLFHVEIQTEERELVTLPNLYLVTHPVTTIRSSGTMITAELTLGYDVPRGQAEGLLLGAAGDAGLGDRLFRSWTWATFP